MNRTARRLRRHRLARSFFRQDPIALARGLLGQRLVSRAGGKTTSGIIVETEAYLGVADKAAHSYGGRYSPRNQTMWGDGGHAYVFFVYGMHHCFNVVAGRARDPVAVLVRALEPDEGPRVMFARRAKARRQTDLCSGPAKLCQALAIERAHDGEDLVDGEVLFIERLRSRPLPESLIVASPRIGIDYAEEWRPEPLRFFVKDNPHVS
ncbi:MAG: DNA-3-methyladenine glycosylase [Acidobacteriota bacterium]